MKNKIKVIKSISFALTTSIILGLSSNASANANWKLPSWPDENSKPHYFDASKCSTEDFNLIIDSKEFKYMVEKELPILNIMLFSSGDKALRKSAQEKQNDETAKDDMVRFLAISKIKQLEYLVNHMSVEQKNCIPPVLSSFKILESSMFKKFKNYTREEIDKINENMDQAIDEFKKSQSFKKVEVCNGEKYSKLMKSVESNEKFRYYFDRYVYKFGLANALDLVSDDEAKSAEKKQKDSIKQLFEDYQAVANNEFESMIELVDITNGQCNGNFFAQYKMVEIESLEDIINLNKELNTKVINKKEQSKSKKDSQKKK